MTHDIPAARLFAEYPIREAAANAERLARQEAVLRRFGTQIAPQSWEYALSRIAGLLWVAAAIMALRGLVAL